jgi:hypothetical protein
MRGTVVPTVVPTARATSCRALGQIYPYSMIKRLSEAAAHFTDNPLSVCRR